MECKVTSDQAQVNTMSRSRRWKRAEEDGDARGKRTYMWRVAKSAALLIRTVYNTFMGVCAEGTKPSSDSVSLKMKLDGELYLEIGAVL